VAAVPLPGVSRFTGQEVSGSLVLHPLGEPQENPEVIVLGGGGGAGGGGHNKKRRGELEEDGRQGGGGERDEDKEEEEKSRRIKERGKETGKDIQNVNLKHFKIS